MNRKLQIILLFVMGPPCVSFFGAHFVPSAILNYSTFLLGLLSFALAFPYMFPKREGLVFAVQLKTVGLFITLFAAGFVWDQAIFASLKSTAPFLIWMFFFFMLKHNIEISKTELVIVTIGLLYALIFFYQYRHSSSVIFGGTEEFRDDRGGVPRITFPGDCFLYLLFFIGLVWLTSNKPYKLIWLAFVGIGMTIAVLQVTRQVIFAMIVILVFHFIVFLKPRMKIVFILVCSLGIYFILNSDNPIVTALFEAQKQTNQEGGDYIRVVAAKFFLTQFSPNDFARIFGNGVPYALESHYAIYMAKLAAMEGFFLSDIGLVGLYVMFGILPVIGYIIVWIKSFTLKVPREYMYVKYYLWFILMTSLTSSYVFGLDAIYPTVLIVYIFQKVYKRKRDLLAVANKAQVSLSNPTTSFRAQTVN